MLQIGAASLLQIRASVVTNWGNYYKLRQPFLQNRAAITNWGKIRAIITNWGRTSPSLSDWMKQQDDQCHNDVYVNSFFPCTARLWNILALKCFPLIYDLNSFKSRIKKKKKISCRFSLCRFHVCFNLFVLLFVTTQCLIVAVKSSTEWILIKKNLPVTQDLRDHDSGHPRIQRKECLNQLNYMNLYPKVQTNRLLSLMSYIMRILY